MTREYLEQLNEAQRCAVEYLDGPELVIAGAGSGKTRVLTYKIVHLLANGYEPSRILALTFTNKAAREMRERIQALTGDNVARRLWMGTFHSIFSRILRRDAAMVGYTPNFTIYDTDNSKSLIKSIIKEFDLDEKVYKVSAVHNAISWAKNSLLSPDDYKKDRELVESDRRSGRSRIYLLYQVYVQRCRIADAMDFDDLLYYTAVLFRDHPEVLGHYREFFRYVLVDEYQDTNFAQNMIMTMLCKGVGNICMVGDDAQSIYSFRGANIRNIMGLNHSYPNLQTFKLEQNYRSTQNIVNAANSLIAKNNEQIRKTIYSENDVGDRIEVQSGHSDYDEAGLVASQIVTRRARTGDPLSEFAILYRTNAQSRVLEEALRRRNILYRIFGGTAFYNRKEVKDAISYFRLAINPNDDEALRRVINVPARAIGKVTVDKLSAAAIAADVSIWSVINNPSQYNIDLNSGALRKINGFATLISIFISQAQQLDAEQLARMIIARTGLLAMYLSESTPESISKQENLQELIKSAHEYVADRIEEGNEENATMANFLAEVALQTDQDEDNPALADSVSLMTIHAAKGLEFSNVFVVGVEDQLLPSAMSSNSPAEIEEERRLFYVAITRAKKFCMLSYALSRYINGQTMICSPSRFLKDIDTDYLKFSYGSERLPFEMGINRPSRPAKTPMFTINTPAKPNPNSDAAAAAGVALHTADELYKGQHIEHMKFGNGEIIEILSTDIGDSVIVEFEAWGEKRLLLKYANFKIID